ncbi:MAG: DUF4012 domain-containing protein [Nocardioides sp.]
MPASSSPESATSSEATTSSSSAADRGRRRPRRRRVLLFLGLAVVVVLVALAVSAVSLVRARSEALAAQNDLVRAKSAISAQDFKAAREATDSARANAAKADGHANGIGSDVWNVVPVASGAVSDMRYLVDALSQSVSVAEIGVDIYPKTMGPRSKLVSGETINLSTLKKITDAAQRIGPHLDAASSDLGHVQGDAPVVGRSIVSARTRAEDQIGPLQESFQRYSAMLGQLPNLFGASGNKKYLLAILNPAELRYSGGATLSLSTLSTDAGTLSFGQSYTVAEIDQSQPFLRWPRVAGNSFHRPGALRLTAATFSPYWSVSGEELLRAWKAQTHQRLDGVIALDLPALADLFRITGPVNVAGYGELNAGNLVRTLAGSYDTYQDATQRHTLNQAIVPAFRSRLLTGGKFLQKGQSLGRSGTARHFVTYFHDPATESAFATAGLAGNLSDTPHDYLGVFTQNVNGSKADYWQHRSVESDVKLAADGSADVRLKVTINNVSPPYEGPLPDPRSGYFTRWLGTALSVFLPSKSTLVSATDDGEAVSLDQHPYDARGVYPRSYLEHVMLVPPQGTKVVELHYKVSDAATLDGQHLDYHLALDPQGIVVPQPTSVRVTLPSGYRWSELPTGWHATGSDAATFSNPGLGASTSYDVGATR